MLEWQVGTKCADSLQMMSHESQIIHIDALVSLPPVKFARQENLFDVPGAGE